MNEPPSSALAHFRVLDLTRVRAGPTSVKQLADFGVDVIKIELAPAVELDTMSGPRHGFDMQNLHRNKRSMTLNLKQPEGVAIFLKLVERADVVVESFRPDVKHRLGIGYEALRKVNPRIILASISGFGQDGPYRERPGFDQIAQGMGGLMYAALGILTALLQAQIGLMDFQAARFLMTGEVPPQGHGP